jgi:hypothetical protein
MYDDEGVEARMSVGLDATLLPLLREAIAFYAAHARGDAQDG